MYLLTQVFCMVVHFSLGHNEAILSVQFLVCVCIMLQRNVQSELIQLEQMLNGCIQVTCVLFYTSLHDLCEAL